MLKFLTFEIGMEQDCLLTRGEASSDLSMSDVPTVCPSPFANVFRLLSLQYLIVYFLFLCPSSKYTSGNRNIWSIFSPEKVTQSLVCLGYGRVTVNEYNKEHHDGKRTTDIHDLLKNIDIFLIESCRVAI